MNQFMFLLKVLLIIIYIRLITVSFFKFWRQKIAIIVVIHIVVCDHGTRTSTRCGEGSPAGQDTVRSYVKVGVHKARSSCYTILWRNYGREIAKEKFSKFFDASLKKQYGEEAFRAARNKGRESKICINLLSKYFLTFLSSCNDTQKKSPSNCQHWWWGWC